MVCNNPLHILQISTPFLLHQRNPFSTVHLQAFHQLELQVFHNLLYPMAVGLILLIIHSNLGLLNIHSLHTNLSIQTFTHRRVSHSLHPILYPIHRRPILIRHHHCHNQVKYQDCHRVPMFLDYLQGPLSLIHRYHHLHMVSSIRLHPPTIHILEVLKRTVVRALLEVTRALQTLSPLLCHITTILHPAFRLILQ